MPQHSHIDDAVEALSLQIENHLLTVIPKILSGVNNSRFSARERAAVVLDLESAILGAGLPDVYQTISDVFAEEISVIREIFKSSVGEEITFAAVDKEIITELVNIYTDSTMSKLREYSVDLQGVVTQQVLTGEALDIPTIIAAATPRVARAIKTEISTGTFGFSRAVTIKKGKELGLKFFLYTGPDDKVTRPFCGHLLGDTSKKLTKEVIPVERQSAVYSLDEIRAMDNGQALDVFIYAGGYNCRHTWSPISESEARRRGVAV